MCGTEFFTIGSLCLVVLLHCTGSAELPTRVDKVIRSKRQLKSVQQWSDWSDWSSCSPSCDIGVTRRERFCIVPHHFTTTRAGSRPKCQGEHRQYEVCTARPCQSKVDFRGQQCQTDLGLNWTPYIRSDLPQCVVYCQLQATRHIRGLWATDGMDCSIQGGHQGMCIGHKCRPVGCDNRLDSLARLDACGSCNGDGSLCNVIQGSRNQIIEKKDLGLYIPLLTIPENVRSLRVWNNCSQQYFAVGVGYEMVVNSNLTIGPSKTVWAAETSLSYERGSGVEALRGQGPTTQELFIYLIAASIGQCTVSYSYTVPKGKVREPKDYIPGPDTRGSLSQDSAADNQGNKAVSKAPIGIPKCPPCNRAMGRAHYFCSSDYVICASVRNKVQVQGSQFRYNLKVSHVYKSKLKVNPTYMWSETLCDCHKFREGKKYLIMGSQIHSQWVVGSEDFVRDWKTSWDAKLQPLRDGDHCARP